MLKIYDASGVLIRGINEYENLLVVEEINQLNTLHFDIPKELGDIIQHEGYAELQNEGRYVIKEKNLKKDGYEIVGLYDLEELQGFIESKAYVSMTVKAMMDDLLSGTGWNFETSDARVRTATGKTIDKLDFLYAIVRDTFGLEIQFDNRTKEIKAEAELGADKGVYFHDEVNLENILSDSDTYDFATRIIPRGRDGISIEAINGGLPYLENLTYSTKVITRFWSDERYTSLEALKEEAQRKLDIISKPLISYSAKVADLSRLADINILAYEPGDTITLQDRASGIREKQRIIIRNKYLDEPEKDTATLANRLRQLDDSTKNEFDGMKQDFTVIRANLQLLEESVEAKVSRQDYDADKDEIDQNYAAFKLEYDNFTVEVQEEIDGLATKSEVQQSADALTLKFSNIGTSNLLRNSNNFTDATGFENSSVTVNPSFVGNSVIPDFNIDDGTRVSATGGTSILKVYWNRNEADVTLGEVYTISCYVRNHTSNTLNARVNGLTGTSSTNIPANTSRRVVLTGIRDTNNLQFQLRTANASHNIDATVARMKIEAGEVLTSWSQHPTEFVQGVTTINKDGINVSTSASDINTQLASNGLEVREGVNALASFGEAGAVIPTLNADEVISPNLMQIYGGPSTITIGSGRMYGTITSAIQALFGVRRKILLYDVEFQLFGNISDYASVRGFSGNGELSFRFQSGARLNGGFSFYNNSLSIYVAGLSSAYGTIDNANGLTQPVIVRDCSHVRFRWLNIDSRNSTYGINVGNGGSSVIRACDFSRVGTAVICSEGHMLSTSNNRGNATTRSMWAFEAGIVHAFGTQPNSPSITSSTRAFMYASSVSGSDSQYNAPSTQSVQMKDTFTHVDSYTLVNEAGSTKNTYFGTRAAQNRWSTATPQNRGVFVFDSAPFDFYSGGSSITAQIKFRRLNTSHGISGAVQPRIWKINGVEVNLTGTGAVRGGDSGWITITNFTTRFPSGGATIELYRPGGLTGGDSYAIWDRAELEVTVTKTI